MPTYEYECAECCRVYEVRQRISAPALTKCQYCGGPVHRLLAAAPFILKGGGWYATDYPSASRKKAMEAEKKAGASTEAASGAKSADGGTSSTSKPETSKTETSKPGSTPPSSSGGESTATTR